MQIFDIVYSAPVEVVTEGKTGRVVKTPDLVISSDDGQFYLSLC